jgi:hypothetical protein
MMKMYITGIIVLVAAIILNILIQRLGIMGWYDFLSKIQVRGREVFSEMGPADYAWLFVIYPFTLGLSAYAGEKLFSFLTGSIFR